MMARARAGCCCSHALMDAHDGSAVHGVTQLVKGVRCRGIACCVISCCSNLLCRVFCSAPPQLLPPVTPARYGLYALRLQKYFPDATQALGQEAGAQKS
jgi:hypothetical protein